MKIKSEGAALAAKEDVAGADIAVYAAATLSLVAALIHLWVAPEHFLHWWGYGVFFAVVALSQGLFSLFILRWPESALIPLAGIWGNLVVISLYVISRTWGMPYGPGWGAPFNPDVAHVEDPELLGMSATAAEVAIVILLVALLGGARRRWTVNALLSLGVLLWALRLTGILP
ncbi:MAG TPA: hypothetical protein VFJ72_11915 [Rubrobacteraceae bacterium]|nr:hypothetical protein [Rubrobacteraceae bacterium]